MEDRINLELVLQFLSDLSKNNNKPWFDQNRARYEAARDSFERFINIIIDEFRTSDGLADLSARDCIARIYRDIRFSKDKSPYKTNLWATIAPGGKHTTRMGYHVALQPQGRSIVAGGMWEPSSEQLVKFRHAIDRDAMKFRAIITDKSFVNLFGKLEGEKLRTAPQGYDKTNPNIDLLRFKQIMVVHHYQDSEVITNEFTSQVISVCKAMRPFLDYLDQFI